MLSPKRLLHLRQKVLWTYKSLEECAMDEDGDSGAFHLAIESEGMILACASFFRTKHPSFPHPRQYRLRAMAVDPSHRKKDFGKMILKHAEFQLRSIETDLLWFDARLVALGFYKRLGFKQTGEAYEKPKAGTHFLMFKEL